MNVSDLKHKPIDTVIRLLGRYSRLEIEHDERWSDVSEADCETMSEMDDEFYTINEKFMETLEEYFNQETNRLKSVG